MDGSRQVHGIAYTESFALIVKYTTLLIFPIAAVYDMCVHQLHVESTFTYAPLHKAVYMHLHPKCMYHVVFVLIC